jgi:hypothetical protein
MTPVFEASTRIDLDAPPDRVWQTLAVTHWSPLTGESDEPGNHHLVTHELESLGRRRTGLTLTHGNSPGQDAADGMVETGWMPMLLPPEQVAEGT